MIEMNLTTHGFQKLSLKNCNLKRQRVDLIGQFRRQSMFLFVLRAQLSHQTVQLPVLGNGVTSASLFRIEFHLQLTHLSVTMVPVNSRKHLKQHILYAYPCRKRTILEYSSIKTHLLRLADYVVQFLVTIGRVALQK